jgi:hypothetical protein
MKRIALLTCVVLLSATAVSAETGALCLFSDGGGTECNIVDEGGLVQVYIVHTQTDGAMASQFMLDVSTAGWTWIGDSWNFTVVVGNSFEGVSIAYGGCQTGSIVLGVANLMGTSASADTPISIVAHPDVEDVLVVDCEDNTMIGAGGTAYVNSSLACVCETNQTPTLDVNPTSLDFGYLADALTLTVANIGGGTLTWDLTESIPWLEVSSASGTNNEDITVTIDRTGLSDGVYSGTIEVTSNGGNESVVVSMTVTSTDPVLVVTPPSFTFVNGQSDQTLFVKNEGINDLIWSITSDQPWLTVSPASGTNNTQVTVHVDRTGLPDGDHYGNLTVTSNGGDATVPVTLLFTPVLAVSANELYFSDTVTEELLNVINAGQGNLEWSITSDQPWLTVSPAAGTNNTAVTVQVDLTGLPMENHNGTLFVTSNGGNTSVAVALILAPLLQVSPASLDFKYLGTERYLDVINAGEGTLEWSITSDQPWVSVTPTSGVDDTQLTVTADRTGLGHGIHNSNLLVTSNGGDATVEVVVRVDLGEILEVIPASLSFDPYEGAKTLNINNVGSGNMSWSITSDQPWLSVDPASYYRERSTTVHVDRRGLAEGTYFGNLFVTSEGGDATVPVTMEVATLTTTAGGICIFSDPAGTECNIMDAGGLVSVYLVHVGSDGAKGSRFELDVSAAGWTHLGDMWNFADVIGSSVGGVRINYGACMPSPIALGVANFMGTSAPGGTPISIVPDLATIKITDCNDNQQYGSGGTAFVNSSLPCICGEDPNPNPVLYVSPLDLDFGDTDVAGAFSIANFGGATLTWDVTESIPWLDASPASGTNNDMITVTVDRTGLSEGTYNGVIDVSSNGGNETVTVTMNVPYTEPVLDVTPAALTFNEGEDAKPMSVINVGTGQLDWQITSDQSWLTATPAAGANGAVVSVQVDRAGMSGGTYYGNLFVTSNGGDATVPVTLVVPVPITVLGVFPAALTFGSSETDKPLEVSNTGTGDLEWSITPDQTWLTATPASGTNDTQVNVHVDRTGLADGAHQANLSVTSNGGDATVPIDIWVGPVPVLSVAPTTLIYTNLVTTSTFSIANIGEGTLDWALSADKAWIEIVPPLTGTNDATVTVNVDPASVPSGGVKVGHVSVNSNGGNQTVEIRYVPPGTDIPGAIGVFEDAGGTDCNFVDSGGLVQVHILHLHHGGATAAQFKLDISSVGWTWLGDNWSFAAIIGQSTAGVSIGYGSCQAAPTYLGFINFFGNNAPECRYIEIVPDPAAASGQIEVVGCSENKMYAMGNIGVVNPNGYCMCGGIPVQETTWGRIKAMYGTK